MKKFIRKKPPQKAIGVDVRKLLKTEESRELEDKTISTKAKKDILKELTAIYKEPDGKIPDMSKIEHKKRSKGKLILVCLAVFFAFLAGLSWLGFFILKPTKFSGEGVRLEILAPTEVAGGEEVTYQIRWQNDEAIPLGQAEIEVHYPTQFVFKSAEPEVNSGNLWKLGSIPVGGSGEIKISGQLFGEIDSFENLEAVLTYKPADFNSNFQKIARAQTKIKSSLLEISVQGPEKILVNDKVTYKIKYSVNSETSFQNIKIKVEYPEHFVFESAEPKNVTGDNSVWLIPSLEGGHEEQIEIVGAFVGDVEGSQELKAQIGFVIDDKFYLQKEAVLAVEVIRGDTLLTLIVNGDNKDRALNFGDILNYSIVYKNNSQVEMADIEIKVTFETTSKDNKSLLEWKTLVDEAGGQVTGAQISENVRAGTITWTKRQIKNLASLGPGAEGTINFQIKIKDYDTVKEWGFENFEIKSLAEMKITKMGGLASEPKVVGSNSIAILLNSNLEFTSEARYFNDDNVAVGSGPIPPKVGEVTAYRIFWKLTNSLHEIEDLKVSAVLPQNINWSEKFELEAGNINFNPATREIIWTLNRLPLNVKSVGVNFEITVKPETKDLGKLLILLPSAKATGTDKVTGGHIVLNAGELTSNLDGDPQFEGRGIVVE